MATKKAASKKRSTRKTGPSKAANVTAAALPRPGTLRADAIDLLKKGTTFDKIVDLCTKFSGKKTGAERRAKELLWIIRSKHNVTVADSDGKLKAK